MTGPDLRVLVFLPFALFATPLIAENHTTQGAFGVTYGNEDCNNDASFLTENAIVCTAVFSETNVWDFLNNLPRRISLDQLVALNPGLDIQDYETVLSGITFVRVR